MKILKIDHEGAFDGGATFLIGGAAQLKGAEVETERRRLFRSMPEWKAGGGGGLGQWVET